MYFITNSENYIVAASKEFLEKSGSRDLCAIASSLKNGTVRLESETSLFKASNFSEDLRFESSKLFSAFGTLTLYKLSDIIEESKSIVEEDESINYLKQLREGVIKKDDHEFSIPTISTIQKSEVTPKVKDDIEKSDLVEESNSKVIEESIAPTISLEPETQIVEDKENLTIKESISESPTVEPESYATVKLFGNHKSEQSEEKSEDTTTPETIKLTEYSSEAKENESNNDTKELVTPEKTQESVEKVEQELTPVEEKEESENFDIKPLDEQQLVIEEKGEEELKPLEKIAEVATGGEEESGSKNKGLNRLKEKLFPWGSKLEENIELEESHKEKVLTTASDLLETKEHSQEKKFIESDYEESEKVTSQEPIYSEVIEKQEQEDEVVLPVIETKEESITTQKVSTVEEPVEEEPIIIDTKEAEPTLEEQELAELKRMHQEKIKETKSQTVTTEAVAPQEIKKVVEPTQLQSEVVAEKKESKTISSADSSKLYYKLIQMQVDGVNLEQNAKNLSIDLDSYKMLLGNYLDELDNYREDLENRSDSTISMLEDASELLSLTPVSKKLKELRDANSDHSSILRDVTLFESLLREKLVDKSAIESISEKKVIDEKSSETEEKLVSTEALKEAEVAEEILPAQEVIDITSAQSLLEKIESKDVSFDPHHASNDLNLPVSLILEFVDDFIAQAKEHLSQMVKAYKEKDIKTMQTTAHMLKGAASNLRLDSVSETLFSLQKLQSMDKSEELLKEFVSKLKGLESEVESFESNK